MPSKPQNNCVLTDDHTKKFNKALENVTEITEAVQRQIFATCADRDARCVFRRYLATVIELPHAEILSDRDLQPQVDVAADQERVMA